LLKARWREEERCALVSCLRAAQTFSPPQIRSLRASREYAFGHSAVFVAPELNPPLIKFYGRFAPPSGRAQIGLDGDFVLVPLADVDLCLDERTERRSIPPLRHPK
jgi:hypothetical protein